MRGTRAAGLWIVAGFVSAMAGLPCARACNSNADCIPQNPAPCIRYSCQVPGSPGTQGCGSEPIDAGPCDDGNPCFVGDHCIGGYCMSGSTTGLNCNDGDPCTADTCFPSGCVHIALNCDDGNACTTDTCNGFSCTHATVTCNDGDSCTTDSCNPSLGCQNICSSPESCVLGEVAHINIASNKTLLAWDQVPGAATAVYDVVRGRTDQFPVGTGAAESSVICGHTARIRTDNTVPPAGVGLWYDVRGRTGCGPGPYGMQSNGLPRTTTACP